MKLLWGFSWGTQSLFHKVALYALLPVIAYVIGKVVGVRVLIEGENALLQGTAGLLSCLLIGVVLLLGSDLLHQGIFTDAISLHTTSVREISTLLANAFIPIAPLGILLGASLGLLKT